MGGRKEMTYHQERELVRRCFNSKPRQTPNVERTVKVWNDYFSGEAVWRRVSNVWACVRADESVAWMLKTHFRDVKNELLRRGFRWEWL